MPEGVARRPVGIHEDAPGDTISTGAFLMTILIKILFRLVIRMKAITKSWKTTVIAVLTALFGVLQATGVIDIPAEVQQAVIVCAVFLIGIFASDASHQKGK